MMFALCRSWLRFLLCEVLILPVRFYQIVIGPMLPKVWSAACHAVAEYQADRKPQAPSSFPSSAWERALRGSASRGERFRAMNSPRPGADEAELRCAFPSRAWE